MAITYTQAPASIVALLQSTLEKYHPELHKVGLTVGCLIALRVHDDEDVHALMRSGYPIDAKIGITSLVDRARGLPDAKLLIDGLEWNKASDRQRIALLDHELEHLILPQQKPSKKEPHRSGPKYDDLSRPVLKMKPHDWMLAGFKDVAERHQQHSHEIRQFQAWRDEYGQLNMFGPDVVGMATAPKQVTAASASELDLSTACARRHHKQCSYAPCQCSCHAAKP